MAWEAKKPLSVETIDVQPPKSGEVRVKVSGGRSGYYPCSTDIVQHDPMHGRSSYLFCLTVSRNGLRNTHYSQFPLRLNIACVRGFHGNCVLQI